MGRRVAACVIAQAMDAGIFTSTPPPSRTCKNPNSACQDEEFKENESGAVSTDSDAVVASLTSEEEAVDYASSAKGIFVVNGVAFACFSGFVMTASWFV